LQELIKKRPERCAAIHEKSKSQDQKGGKS